MVNIFPDSIMRVCIGTVCMPTCGGGDFVVYTMMGCCEGQFSSREEKVLS